MAKESNPVNVESQSPVAPDAVVMYVRPERDPLQAFLQLLCTVFVPSVTKREAVVTAKKETGVKPVADAKPIERGGNRHWFVRAAGATPELIFEGCYRAAAKLYQKAVAGIGKGAIPAELVERARIAAESLLTPETRAALLRDAEYLLLATPEPKPSTMFSLILRSGKVESKVSISCSNPTNLTNFLATLKPGVKVVVFDAKTKLETPISEKLAEVTKVAAEQPAEAVAA